MIRNIADYLSREKNYSEQLLKQKKSKQIVFLRTVEMRRRQLGRELFS